jgi:hypothetical protein
MCNNMSLSLFLCSLNLLYYEVIIAISDLLAAYAKVQEGHSESGICMWMQLQNDQFSEQFFEFSAVRAFVQ